MGWQDDEVVSAQPAQSASWQADQVVAPQQPQTLLERFKANQARQDEALKAELANTSWLERQAAGMGSAAAKAGYGLKQLVTGELSPEDRASLRDWETIATEAPVGNVAGNVALMALPAGAISKVGQAAKIPMLAKAGTALATPATVGQAAGGSALYSALQPTEKDGVEGLKERVWEGGKGALWGAGGYGVLKGLSSAMAPKQAVVASAPVSQLSGVVDDVRVAKPSSATPEELARIETLKSLPVPITEEDIIRSQITRKYHQQEAERLIAGQPMIGSEIAARLERGQAKMGENLDALAEMSKAKAPSQEQAGEVMRNWMQNIYGAAKKDTTAAYNYARELHGDATTKVSDDIVKSLTENQAMPGYRELLAQAKNMGIVKDTTKGIKAGTVKINDLDKYKEIANTLTTSSDGMTRHAGGDIVNKIYSQLDDIAPEFKQAAALRKRQGAIFEGPTVTQKILGTKQGAYGAAEKEAGGLTIPDYKVSSEKLIDTVMNGSIEDVRYIRGLALSGTKAQRAEGVQSIREMRGAIVENMKDVWTKTQTPQAKANQLNKYLDKLGDEKIELLFGKAGANQIRKFRDAAEIMNKSVPSPEGGSQTAGRLMNMASSTFKLLEKLPVVGSTTAKAATVIKDIGVASAAKKIPSEKIYSPARIKAANKLAELAPYGYLIGSGVAAE